MSQSVRSGHSSTLLALSADATQATAALVEPVAGSHRLIAWEQVQASSHGEPEISRRLRTATQNLGARLGRELWDEEQDSPLLTSPEAALGLQLGQVVAAVDPLPPLRVWLAGLTSFESLAAAQASLSATLCTVSAIYRYGAGHGQNSLSQNSLSQSQLSQNQLSGDLAQLRPDLLILVGGYDRPGADAIAPVYALAAEVALALADLPPEQRPALYFAGNRHAAGACLDLLAHLPGGTTADALPNVAPGPGLRRTAPLAVAISRLYWRRCRATPALRTAGRWITPPGEVRSISWSFAQAVQLWRQVQGLPHLHGLYCGSAPWVHIRADEGQEGVRLLYTPPGTRPPALDGWPPVQLVSGPWPSALWPRLPGQWWDGRGLLPTIANLGQIDPAIAYEVMAQDLLRDG